LRIVGGGGGQGAVFAVPIFPARHWVDFFVGQSGFP
jgi:hypothetical protein